MRQTTEIATSFPCGHIERLQQEDLGPQRRGDVPSDDVSRVDVGRTRTRTTSQRRSQRRPNAVSAPTL